MEETKQETIVKLYSLRAGLSLLSKIQNEAAKKVNVIKGGEAEIQKYERQQGYIEKDIEAHYAKTVQSVEYEIKKLEKEIPVYDREVIECAEKLKKLKEEKQEKFKEVALFFPLSFLVSLAITIFSFQMIITCKWEYFMVFIPGITVWIALGSLGLFLVHLENLKYNPKALKAEPPADPKKELGKPDPRDVIEEKKILLEQRKKEHEAYDKECQEKIIDINGYILDNAEISYGAQEELLLIIERFKVAHKAVQEQFCSFIDERDWGNVDLIIFNYETGRALDLRDALIQVDNERRNERLVKAVQDASIAICSNIQRGFGALQSTFKHQMDMLDGKIASLASQSSRQMKAIAENGKAQQALLDKMSISSDRLVNDVQYMRSLAETAYSK